MKTALQLCPINLSNISAHNAQCRAYVQVHASTCGADNRKVLRGRRISMFCAADAYRCSLIQNLTSTHTYTHKSIRNVCLLYLDMQMKERPFTRSSTVASAVVRLVDHPQFMTLDRREEKCRQIDRQTDRGSSSKHAVSKKQMSRGGYAITALHMQIGDRQQREQYGAFHLLTHHFAFAVFMNI